MLPRGSLRKKIIVWSFIPTAIILVAVALVSLYAYQRVTENLVIERDRELTRLSAKLLAAELATYTDPFAEQFLAIFDGIIVFDERGNILAAEPNLYADRPPSWLKSLALPQASQADKPVFSDVVVDRQNDERIAVVVMPIAGQPDRSRGGVAGFFRLDSRGTSGLSQSLENLRRAENNCIYLVDSNGRVIYHSNSDHIGKDFSSQAAIELLLDGWAGAHRTQDLEGQDIVASFAPVPGTSWGLVTEESWATLTQSSRRYGQLLFILLGLGIVAPAVIVTVGVRRITQPIAQLIQAAQEIAEGHFGRRITAQTGDELEKLAEHFNLMASRLQESYAYLEQKVADRTKELATLNAIAAQASQSLDLEEILKNALAEILEAMSMESGQAFRLDADTQTLISIAQHGYSEEFVQSTARLPLNACIEGAAAEQGKPIVRRLAEHPQDVLRDCLEAEGVRLTICIPLIAQSRIVGAINLGSRSLRAITPEESSLLASIGHQIGVAVDNARLYEQAQQLAVMKERNRLARDLHDSVTQALYGVTLYAEAATRQLSSGETDMVADHLSEIRITAQESLREMRLLIFELRLPALRSEGLAAALRARLESVESRAGLDTVFRVEGDSKLAHDVEEGLYRIAQEALNNTLKHAHASSVSIVLHHNDRVVSMCIEDDGVGFDPTEARVQSGFGLKGMEERVARLGGKLVINSSPGKGTRIEVEVSQ
jgi:nitrate/nitrite-specific signal transduction histidine kinase